MLVRDEPRAGSHTGSPLQVLMVRRNLRSDFVGGAYVFPGGAVDPSDAGPETATLCEGRTDEEASVVLGVEAGGLAYWVGALRETFEEAGVLLAYEPGGRLLSYAPPGAGDRFARHRAALNDSAVVFADLCRAERLRLAVDQVHYFAHWITPEFAPRRYDTRFFVAGAPTEQTPLHDNNETIADLWVHPEEALRRHRAGEIELIFPTIRNLQAIARFETAEDLLRAAAGAASVPAVVARVVADGRGVRVLLPGDPGYDEAPGDRLGADSRDFDEAVRAVSKAANPVGDLGEGPSAGASGSPENAP
jgi:8-oxo-dGTP pyrophosphatase MutT (NUDIX family)